eukprot:CAMPEP_0196710776 /NCGR_PEP_ID=MMETSP1090-20130531/70927_1 /TAXON_ID=37098 /ORGANISM="Isochrysis sp, Strain CCMP1244" /LENGTH=119 /DNA_ID=CAMNT_0042050813 /DNA_START=52 /DNA_END=407 /DNA_ORIENTATION=-
MTSLFYSLFPVLFRKDALKHLAGQGVVGPTGRALGLRNLRAPTALAAPVLFLPTACLRIKHAGEVAGQRARPFGCHAAQLAPPDLVEEQPLRATRIREPARQLGGLLASGGYSRAPHGL